MGIRAGRYTGIMNNFRFFLHTVSDTAHISRCWYTVYSTIPQYTVIPRRFRCDLVAAIGLERASFMELVPKGKTTSPVWRFFGFEAGADGNPKNEELAVCRIASGCRKKTVMVRGGNTSNLLSHHHPKEFMEVNQARKGKGAQKVTKSSKGQASVADLIEREVKYERSSRKWKQLTDSVTFCLAKDMLPMYTVE